MNDQHDEKLERFVEGVCSGLPLRRAPAELERYVLDELARRAALPWWRRGFAQWPAAARGGLLGLCALLGGLSLTSGVTRPFEMQTLAWLRPALSLMSTIGEMRTLLASVIPPLWIYLALGIGALLYVLLFGLGAVAYRTLYLQHSNTAMIRS
jgi:hypothetical protein